MQWSTAFSLRVVVFGVLYGLFSGMSGCYTARWRQVYLALDRDRHSNDDAQVGADV
ncbi:hypothetical protein OG21DRAFT_1518278 [Imleria badia]|nr:hypothetical protein OG21DRAFT_1518278 [Imleria badia]